MARQVLHVSGEDIVVREDTAKAYRGVHWALLSVAAFIVIAALLFFGGFFAWLTGTTNVTPATGGPSQNSVQR
jgi:hypothetical protein